MGWMDGNSLTHSVCIMAKAQQLLDFIFLSFFGGIWGHGIGMVMAITIVQGNFTGLEGRPFPISVLHD
jgi:hypothetical protein